MRQPDWAGACGLRLMYNQKEIDAYAFMGKWTLIVGEINSGKTFLSRRILQQVSLKISDKRLAVIDMAPVIPKDTGTDNALNGIGGQLIEPDLLKGLYLSSHIDPPRLSTDTEEAALVIAERNLKKIEKLLQTFSKTGRDVLFVNDISLYLQFGNAENLIRYFSGVNTLVANGYFGEKLGEGILSQREHQEMQTVQKAFSKVIRL
jgi:hypothetical protein